MAILDILLLLCFIPAIVVGITKGFVQQLIEVVAIILGAWAAFRFSSMVSTWLAQYLTFQKGIIHVLSFIVIVIVVTLLLYILGHLLTKIIKLMTLGWLNRLLGLLFGIAKVALILGIVILVFEALNGAVHIVKEETLADAVVYQHLKIFAGKVFPYLKNLVTGINA